MTEKKQAADKAALKNKKRYRKMMLHRFEVGAGLCAVLGVILYLLCAFVFFKVGDIKVQGLTDAEGNTLPGSSYYSADEIAAASGVQIGSSLVNVSKDSVADAIERTLPYIGKVTVKRSYPSTLTLIVEDTKECFAVQTGIYTVLDENFKVLTVNEKIPEGCAEITGVNVAKTIVGQEIEFEDNSYKEKINSLLKACEEAEMDGVTKIDIESLASIKLVFNHKITVVLGSQSNVDKKLDTAKKTIAEELKIHAEARIIVDVNDYSKVYVRDDTSPLPEEDSTAYPDSDDNTPNQDYDGGDSDNDDDWVNAVG